jgi:hypothetical protein
MSERTASGTQPEPSNRPGQMDRHDVPSPGPDADVLFELSAETSPVGATRISVLSRGLVHGLWLPPCVVGCVVRFLGASTAVSVSALGVMFVACALFVGYQLKTRAVFVARPGPSSCIIDARDIETVATPGTAADPDGPRGRRQRLRRVLRRRRS